MTRIGGPFLPEIPENQSDKGGSKPASASVVVPANIPKGKAERPDKSRETSKRQKLIDHMGKQLEKAVKNDDQEEVKRLMKAGVSPDWENHEGKSMLYFATELGRVHLVIIMRPRADPNKVCPKDGSNAMHIASFHGFADVLRALLMMPY